MLCATSRLFSERAESLVDWKNMCHVTQHLQSAGHHWCRYYSQIGILTGVIETIFILYWKQCKGQKSIKRQLKSNIKDCLAHYSLFGNTEHIMCHNSRLSSNGCQQAWQRLYAFKHSGLNALQLHLWWTHSLLCQERNILNFRSNYWTGSGLPGTHF